MLVSWFSGGVSSFVACYLLKKELDKIIYIHIDDQHFDTIRFLKDCEKHLGQNIEILQSEYSNVNNVIKAFRFVNGPYGARCTDVLKKRVRKEWEAQHKNLTYIWGYDAGEANRAERLENAMPEFKHRFPLIEKGLSKEDAHGILKQLKIKRPKMYDMGYRNNNCVGCVKGGMGYWNNIRRDFPEVFKQRAEVERLVNNSCINGVFLDELDPNRGRWEHEILEECGIGCQMNL
jgi:3'-phosphoadenosine 5'-phosphosulfate sulfotransferase (PAPS reductase)/FAD synthetase